MILTGPGATERRKNKQTRHYLNQNSGKPQGESDMFLKRQKVLFSSRNFAVTSQFFVTRSARSCKGRISRVTIVTIVIILSTSQIDVTLKLIMQ